MTGSGNGPQADDDTNKPIIKRPMNKTFITRTIAFAVTVVAAQAAAAQDYNVHHSGDTVIAELSPQAIFVRTSGDTTIVEITSPKRYIFLPVEKDKPEVRVQLSTGSPDDPWKSVRLAREKIDYYTPMPLGGGEKATLKFLGIAPDALALQALKMDDTWSKPRNK